MPTHENPFVGSEPLRHNGRSDTMVRDSTLLNADAPGLHVSPIDNLLVTYRYGDRKAILIRQASYDRAVSIARDHFNITGDITLSTTLSDSTESYEISPEVWGVVSASLCVVLVWASTDSAVVDGPGISNGAAGGRLEMTQESPNVTTIVLICLDNKRYTLDIRESDPISQIFDRSASLTSIPRDQIRLIYAGRQLEDGSSTVRDNGIKDGSRVWITLRLRGGKPVIYLYPPTAMGVSVKLSLIPAWEYSAIYPFTMIKRLELAKGQVGQLIEWNVNASPSGLLRDKLSGREITYLFWEAETCANPHQSTSTPPSSRASSPTLNSPLAENLVFDPSSPQVTPDESILLPAHKIPSYLDDALTALGLHVEARTSFITYWLPSIMKHPHVALRFLPQEHYEAAASMEVTPRPDVVTRIFMVARGLENEEAQREEWVEGSLRASQPVEIWQKIVGMSLERALDPTVFRVLEWGGMFVN